MIRDEQIGAIMLNRHSVIKVANIEVIILKFRNWFGHVEYECKVLHSEYPNIRQGEIVHINPNNPDIFKE